MAPADRPRKYRQTAYRPMLAGVMSLYGTCEVDRDPRPGRFLLTGSARLLELRDLPDALPGRTETVELWPLSQGEIDSAADGFVDAVFRLDGNVRMRPCSLTKRDYLARALRGGQAAGMRRGPRRH